MFNVTKYITDAALAFNKKGQMAIVVIGDDGPLVVVGLPQDIHRKLIQNDVRFKDKDIAFVTSQQSLDFGILTTKELAQARLVQASLAS